jgi:hypothetical protein
MTTGVIYPQQPEAEKKAAYAADITYATNNELGFDYLRDNMKAELTEMSQRGHNFAIVDEVDSILIDEARTPLIISGPARTARSFTCPSTSSSRAAEEHLHARREDPERDLHRRGQRVPRRAAARGGPSCPKSSRSTIPNRPPSSTTSTRACARTSCSRRTRTTSSATARSS